MISIAALNQHVDDEEKVHTCWQFPTKILCLFLVGWSYLLIGGAVFSHLEKGEELSAERQYLGAIDNAIADGNFTTNQTQVLMNLLDTLDELRSTAVNIGKTDWSFVGATYFATTAVTTIGYGWIAPKTVGGRVFCILYSVIGIPLVFYMFAYLGRKMMDIIGFRISSLREGSEYKRKQLQSDSVVLPMFVALFIAALLISVFAIAFTYTETWTYFESFYFVFITMTTIGFGDFVPTYRDHPVPLILQVFGIFLALSVYSYLINVAIVLVTRLVHNVTRKSLSRMDIRGTGHIGPAEFVYCLLGRTQDRRLRYQAQLLDAVLQKDLDYTARAAILQEWGQAVALGFKHLQLPRGLKLYIVLGGPASGKTLMCKKLASKYGLERIDVERLILLEVLSETGRGRAIESLINHGCVLPKQVILDLIISRLKKLPPNCSCILDGFPLDVHQARFLEQECKYAERVFLLQCSDELLEERLFQMDRSVVFGIRALLGPRLQSQPSSPHATTEQPRARGVGGGHGQSHLQGRESLLSAESPSASLEDNNDADNGNGRRKRSSRDKAVGTGVGRWAQRMEATGVDVAHERSTSMLINGQPESIREEDEGGGDGGDATAETITTAASGGEHDGHQPSKSRVRSTHAAPPTIAETAIGSNSARGSHGASRVVVKKNGHSSDGRPPMLPYTAPATATTRTSPPTTTTTAGTSVNDESPATLSTAESINTRSQHGSNTGGGHKGHGRSERGSSGDGKRGFLQRQPKHSVSIEIEDLEGRVHEEPHGSSGVGHGGHGVSGVQTEALEQVVESRSTQEQDGVGSSVSRISSSSQLRPNVSALVKSRSMDTDNRPRRTRLRRSSEDSSGRRELSHVASRNSLFFQGLLREIKASTPTATKKKWRKAKSPSRRHSLSPEDMPHASVSSQPPEVLDEFNDDLLRRWQENKVALRDYFQSHLHEIDAEQSIDDTFESLCRAFESSQDSSFLEDFSTLSGNFPMPGATYPEQPSGRRASKAALKRGQHHRRDKNTSASGSRVGRGDASNPTAATNASATTHAVGDGSKPSSAAGARRRGGHRDDGGGGGGDRGDGDARESAVATSAAATGTAGGELIGPQTSRPSSHASHRQLSRSTSLPSHPSSPDTQAEIIVL
ncbi:hypothetical protein PTSG_08078 [Salpingoeca rosetta]|uniref:Potassium channel domain-containing protein n=1 Tax=Salpingoeca rosetta (strain ATCC 50818 / BSB-021) TaxID=946362 RepID=F2UHX8_SALR5|nr:uncharacterized protein PTSG_08078 [Salpingoeca rosetta]EGD76727.1 hypothetical protein PTSG_08078 [Salpingoeca rosetta]|eukprot:XP_004991099.1 hypothetical protein PTSG_08078 [Salpingoeca rosetta]